MMLCREFDMSIDREKENQRKNRSLPASVYIYIVSALLAVILCIAGLLYFDSVKFAPSRFNIRREQLSSDKIPSQLDNVRILYFSDLKYGSYMDDERLQKLSERIGLVNTDALVFGGDLFDDTAALPENLEQLTAFFKNIDAPLGKFAVLGDTDRLSEKHLAAATEVFRNAGVEILVNKSAFLHNHGSESVTLVGLDNGLNGLPDQAVAYESVSPSAYTITVCHTPDTADSVRGELTDWFLAGHSLGGQAYNLVSYEFTPAMAVQYFRGKHELNSFTLDITSGTGTTGRDIRFLSGAEIVLYTLHHEEASAAPVITPTPDDASVTPAAETPEAETPEENSSQETQTPEETKEDSAPQN